MVFFHVALMTSTVSPTGVLQRPSAPIVRDDELWFYYTGLKWRNTFKHIGKFPNGQHEPIPGRDRDAGAICLAVLRRDGFISLDAGPSEGHITTEPFSISGERLFVNADARGGELRCEIVNELGEVVGSSESLKENFARKELAWRQGEPASLKDQTVSLRFTLHNAKIYSYWLE